MKNAVGVVSLLLAGVAIAAPQPQSIEMGGGKLIPTLVVTQKYDDNIFSQANNEESDSITQLKPSVQWLQEKDTTSIALTYAGDYGFYWDSDDDNYDDHTLSVDALFSPTDIARFDFGASYAKLHDNRGEGSSEGLNALTRPDPDEYDISNIDLEADFGREQSMLGFWVKASRSDIEYQNNRNETVFRDRDESYLAARVYGKISGGKTRFFFEVSQEDFSYDETPLLGGTLDSEEEGYAVGVEWEATAKTTGAIRIGEVEKEFDSVARGKDDVNVWDFDITWAPRTYSIVMFSASQAPQETNGTGTFIDARDYSVTWMHSWSDILSSTVSYMQGEDNYGNSTRNDDRDSFSVGVNYDWRRWMTIGASYSYTDRDSNDDAFDYEKNVFLINLNMSL